MRGSTVVPRCWVQMWRKGKVESEGPTKDELKAFNHSLKTQPRAVKPLVVAHVNFFFF